MNITTGKQPGAQKILCYGPEGIGKSTFAAQFPDPLFIDTEGSTKHMDVKRLDRPTSWAMLLQQVAWVKANRAVCQTLVIDTADWAERLCIDSILTKHRVSGIEDVGGGYGKGYTYLAEEFGRLLNLLSDVTEVGIHVVLTAHSQVRKFEQPDEAAPYDRWELKLQKKTAPLAKEWADMVLFANYKTFAVTSEKTKKTTAQGGKRVMYTSHRPAWDAKNRHELPDELALEGTLPTEIAEAIAFGTPTIAPAPAPAPATAPAPEPEAAAAPPVAEAVATVVAELGATVADMPPHLRKLHDLMKGSGVSPSQIKKAVGYKGYFPADMPIEDYPADFVEGVLVGAWQQVLGIIAEIEKIPF